MVNGSTLWVMYQGFMHLDTETRAAELLWSFLFLVNLAPLTEERACMQVSASNTCEGTILFRVSIFARGLINEVCVLRNVKSWQSLSLADTSDLVLGRAFVPNQIHRGLPRILSLPGITLTLPVPSKNEQRIEQILPCWKSKLSCQCCHGIGHSCNNPVHIDHQSRTESTHACVKQWPLLESHSLHSFHFAKGQINEECLLCNVEN